MMTTAEKIEMYKGKKAFIENISKAFEAIPRVSTVTSIKYEVYYRKININGEERDYYVECVIVNFLGGGRSARFVSGNSCTANFRALGSMLDGGYYDENRDYETLTDRGFTIVDLGTAESNLDTLLRKPMEHIHNIHECFNYCKDRNDIKRVIKMIPNYFGSFEVEYSEDNKTFTIINYYEENGIDKCEETEHEFCVEN